MIAPYQNPELLSLYSAYTAGEEGIGGALTRLAVAARERDPLLVATAAEIGLFPGAGAPAEVLGFRHTTRGFRELAAVSHLGPAVGSLVNMRTMYADRTEWRAGALRLRSEIARARVANTPAMWRERVAAEAYAGREDAIAAMCEYGCALTDSLLQAVLEDESKLDAAFVRRAYLEAATDEIGATVPFNLVMIATFFLVGMDIAHRILRWVEAHGLDWSRAMVLIAGQQGRPTSGVTWTSNSLAKILLAASGGGLALDRLYLAPHGPAFPPGASPQALREAEGPLRRLWAYTRAICELGPTMFEGLPAYSAECASAPEAGEGVRFLSEMPRIAGPDDLRAMTTRLRLVMEDPRQLLSGCVTDYAAERLHAMGGDVSRVVVPGLDGVAYPAGL